MSLALEISLSAESLAAIERLAATHEALVAALTVGLNMMAGQITNLPRAAAPAAPAVDHPSDDAGVPPPGDEIAPAGVDRRRTGARSAERAEVLRRGYTTGVPAAELLAAINALPGPALTRGSFFNWAACLGLKRPVDWKTRHVPVGVGPVVAGASHPLTAAWKTPERWAVLARDWPAGVPPLVLLAALNALPGPALNRKQMESWCYAGRLFRGSAVARSVAAAAEPDAVAAFIAEHGVTRCPPAAAAETSAVIPREAACAIRAHADAQELARINRMQPKIRDAILRGREAA